MTDESGAPSQKTPAASGTAGLEARLAPRRRVLLGFALLLLVFLVFPFVSESPFRIRVLSLGFLFGTLALGLSLSLGFTGLLNLSQGTFYGIGAYTAANLMKHLGVPFLGAMVAAGAVASAGGLVLAWTTYRAKRDYFSLVSLALTVAGYVVMLHWDTVTQRPEGFTGIPLPSILGHELTSGRDLYFVCLALMALCFGVTYLVTESWVGRAMLAVRYDEAAATMMGIAVPFYKFLALGLGSFMAGMAGAAMAVTLLVVTPDSFQFNQSFMITVMVIAGGMIDLFGVVLAACVLTFITAQFSNLYQYSQMIFGGVLMVAVFFQAGVLRGLPLGRRRGRPRATAAVRVGPVAGPAAARVVTAPGTGGDGRSAPGDGPALTVTDLYAGYDGRDYLRGLHLHVAPGETVGVLGTNGAGKSTLLRALSGLLVPRQGRVTFEGRDLRGVPAHEIVRRGIGHVPQGRNMFGDLTAEENIRIGGYTRKSRREVEAEIERQYERWPALRAFARRRARLLSGGEQELVAIVRALMAAPRFLMLDEPSMGLSPVATRDVFGMLKRLGQEYGLSILVVEQNVAAALALADRVYVMAHGEIVAESRADAVTPGELVETYFGRGRAPLSR